MEIKNRWHLSCESILRISKPDEPEAKAILAPRRKDAKKINPVLDDGDYEENEIGNGRQRHGRGAHA